MTGFAGATGGGVDNTKLTKLGEGEETVTDAEFVAAVYPSISGIFGAHRALL
jgi:hypothetical protein